MKKTLRSAMLSTICMLVVAVMSLTGVTYAWFTEGTTASVDNVEISVADASGGLQIGKLENGVVVWGTSVEAPDMPEDGLTPASTDGVVTAAGALKFLSGSINGTTLEAVEESSSYYTFDIYFRNDGNQAIDVILDSTTALLVNGEATVGRSDYATRIAFIPGGNTTIKATMGASDFTNGANSIIYEPNATAHTDGAKIEKAASGWGTTEGENDKWTYKALNTTASYDTVDRYNGANLVAMTTRETTSTDKIVTVNAHSACKVTVYVWIEGQDADCINENAGATFRGDIKFKISE